MMTTNYSTRVKAPDILSSTSPSSQFESNDEVPLKSCTSMQERGVSENGLVEDSVDDCGNSFKMVKGRKGKRKRRHKSFKLKECRVVCKRLEECELPRIEQDDNKVEPITEPATIITSMGDDFCYKCGLILPSRAELVIHLQVCKGEVRSTDSTSKEVRHEETSSCNFF